MFEIDYQISEFMLNCQMKNLTPKTMASYEATLKLFARYLQDNYVITDAKLVKEEMVKRYILYIQERGKYAVCANDNTKDINRPYNRTDYKKKVSPATINNYLRNIKVFFNYLKEERVMKKSPMQNIKYLKNERKPLGFINDDEFIRLLLLMDISKFHEFRDNIIVQLLFDTGMRIGECLSINVADTDITNRSIQLHAENTKGRKSRCVFFSSKMQKDLKAWIQYKDRYVENESLFPTRSGTNLQVHNFEKNFKKYGERAGIKKAHPHQLRNNFAKRFLMAGGSIYTLSKILGHSSVDITEKAYLDLTDADLKNCYEKFSPLANLKNR
jgi:integrase/recombinase XerD